MDLVAQKREIFGKKTNTLRKQGLVPAELYGRGVPNLHLSISIKELNKVLREAGENTLINVVIEEEKPRPALIYSIQSDHLRDEILQVDLYQVRMDEKIEAKVPIEFLGEAPAIKVGGVLVKSMQEIEVVALPADLPRKIEVSISGMETIGQSIYVKNLNVPSGVTIKVPVLTVIATIVEKLTEEKEAAMAEQVSSVETVAVETEEKKKEREAKKEEVVKSTEEKK